jgi:phage shock protein PspC (stress-responsive transcriptional regulator)
MGSLSSLLTILLVFCGAVTAVLVVLVIYGNALDTREEEEIYLNKTEEKMMAGDQAALVEKMHRLARVITVLAIISGISLLASAGVWVYIGLYKS